MKKKLSQEERKEPVNKGFLIDNEYITRSSLEEILDSKNYVTKEWAIDMFEMFHKRISEDFARQTGALIEIIRHENSLIVEALTYRIERVENYIGLPYP